MKCTTAMPFILRMIQREGETERGEGEKYVCVRERERELERERVSLSNETTCKNDLHLQSVLFIIGL